MREWRTFVSQFVIIAGLVICVPTLLRRLGLTGMSPAFLTFILIGAVLFWCETVRLRTRRKSIEETAGSFGFYPVDVSDLRLAIYPLRRAGTVRGAVRGNIRGLQTWLFDYEIPDGEDSYSQTVAAFFVANANLPIFELRPRGLMTRHVDRESQGDDCFESVHFDEVPSFEARFTLKSSAVEGVRRYFKSELLGTLLCLEDCRSVVQGHFTTLVFFAPGVKVPSADLEAFARRCSNVAYALFSSASVPSAP